MQHTCQRIAWGWEIWSCNSPISLKKFPINKHYDGVWKYEQWILKAKLGWLKRGFFHAVRTLSFTLSVSSSVVHAPKRVNLWHCTCPPWLPTLLPCLVDIPRGSWLSTSQLLCLRGKEFTFLLGKKSVCYNVCYNETREVLKIK